MWPTSKYERLEYDLRDSVNGCMDGERITFGILIADARQENAKSYIINYINELDKESESYFDFYIPGYTDDYYWGGKECFYLERNRQKYYFNENDFEDFCNELYNRFAIKYTQNPMLVLISMVPGDYKTKKYIVIELDKNDQYTINRSCELFRVVFKASRTKSNLEGIRAGIVTSYIKNNMLDIVQDILDRTLFIKMVKMCKTYKIYKLE